MAFVTTGKIEQKITSGDFLHASGQPDDFVICKNPDKLKALLNKLSPMAMDIFNKSKAEMLDR